MRDDRCLLSTIVRMSWAVSDRLLHRVEHVQVLNAFDLEIEARQFGANDIGIARGTAILLTAECFEEPRLAELIPPQPLDSFAFLA